MLKCNLIINYNNTHLKYTTNKILFVISNPLISVFFWIPLNAFKKLNINYIY